MAEGPVDNAHAHTGPVVIKKKKSVWGAIKSIATFPATVGRAILNFGEEERKQYEERMREDLRQRHFHSDIAGTCPACSSSYGPFRTRHAVVPAPGGDIIESCGHVICNECARFNFTCPGCRRNLSSVKRVTEAPASMNLHYNGTPAGGFGTHAGGFGMAPENDGRAGVSLNFRFGGKSKEEPRANIQITPKTSPDNTNF